jgi:hypothetical protein
MPLPEYKQLVDEAKREIKEIDPDELKRMQEQKQNFTLIDVREPGRGGGRRDCRI